MSGVAGRKRGMSLVIGCAGACLVGGLAGQLEAATGGATVVLSLEDGGRARVVQEVASYDPVGRRDPFRAVVLERREDRVAVDPATLPPLQRYELERYRLVGVIWGGAAPAAMVETPDGVGHVLHVGDLLGRRQGRVARITPTALLVAEELRDLEGQLLVNEVTLQLP